MMLWVNRRQGLATKNIAIRGLLKVKTDLVNGNVKKIDNSNLTISEWVDIWYQQAEKGWSISTRALRKRVMKN